MANEPILRVGRVLHGKTAEGPGLRTAIWFRGCSIRCKGCINPHLFSPRGGTQLPVAGIIEDALTAEGLILIGGEPFDQPDAGHALALALASYDMIHRLEAIIPPTKRGTPDSAAPRLQLHATIRNIKTLKNL
ncbi:MULTISPECIES: 4Fe-4S cluster-binding domain-containing protein [unclassified Arthrobacter]|uniref:4Fe-4S cluster-binding domain-containing protein n=1 Tax=unclassified Arthrobacter TaxID=235627 RepID=UPI0028834DF7|nr:MULTISPECIES: 4Fe-4S cluster-binding domain-containing protein [unclassified Arthrobacter]